MNSVRASGKSHIGAAVYEQLRRAAIFAKDVHHRRGELHKLTRCKRLLAQLDKVDTQFGPANRIGQQPCFAGLCTVSKSRGFSNRTANHVVSVSPQPLFTDLGTRRAYDRHGGIGQT